MKRLRKDRRRNPLPFSTVFIISFTIFLVLTVLGLIFVEYGIRPTLMTIAKTETQRIAAQSINDAVSKRIVNELDIDELVLLDKNGKGNLTSIRFDPQIYNRVTAEATTRVQRSLESINEGSIAEFFDDMENEDEGIIHYIPLGMAADNALLANFGPKVPVKFTTIGDVRSEIRTDVTHTGINNTLIEVYIYIVANVRVVIPFATDTATVENNIMLSDIFVQGEIPDFYGGSSENGPRPAKVVESE